MAEQKVPVNPSSSAETSPPLHRTTAVPRLMENQLGSQRRSRNRLRVILGNPRVSIPGAVAIVLILIAAVAPYIAPKDPLVINSQAILQPPSSSAWFGTDNRGRDTFSRVIVGTRTSIGIALTSVFFATVFGVAIGLVGGYFGGIWEFLTMRTVDVLLTFPPILLAITVIAFLGSGVANLIFVIALLYMTRFARIAYGMTIQARHLDYVEAARVIGARSPRIILRYILPNIMAPIFVQISLSIGFAILLESGLSFLGLGTPPPAPSWGNMIGAARGFMHQSVWFLLFPSFVISLAILTFNTLGDGLRDSLDPRLRS